MDKALREFLTKEIKFKKCALAPLDMLLLIGTSVAVALLRESVVSYVSMVAVSQTQAVMLNQLKFLSFLFDTFIALLAMDMVITRTGNKIKGFLAYGVMILLPVLAAGSAMWGMGDQVYVFFALLAVSYVLKGKKNLGLISLGVSILINSNGLFLLPVFIGLYFKKEVKAASFLAPLLGFIGNRLLVTGVVPVKIPMITAENLLKETREQTLLSYNYPNIYQIFGTDRFVTEYSQAAYWFVICLGVIIGIFIALSKKPLTKERIMRLFVLSAMIIP